MSGDRGRVLSRKLPPVGCPDRGIGKGVDQPLQGEWVRQDGVLGHEDKDLGLGTKLDGELPGGAMVEDMAGDAVDAETGGGKQLRGSVGGCRIDGQTFEPGKRLHSQSVEKRTDSCGGVEGGETEGDGHGIIPAAMPQLPEDSALERQ